MTVSDNTIQTEGLGSFFENLERILAKAGKNLATNVIKNLGRALDITANIATAAANRNAKAALSTLPEVNNFYHNGEGLYLGKILYLMLYKRPKNVIDYMRVHHLKTTI